MAQGSFRRGEKRTTRRIVVNDEFGRMRGGVREYVADISLGGVFVRSDDPLPVGTPVSLRFTVLLEDAERIEGMGRVVRSVPVGGPTPAGMGVVFTELDERCRALVAQAVARRRADNGEVSV